jgi:hypothetical protein
MATSGSFTIGGASPDYATIQAWADSPTGALTGVYEGKIRAGTYTERADIDHAYATTDANHMKLTYDTGAYHGGDLRGGVSIQGVEDGSDLHLLNISKDYTRVIGLNFNRWTGTSTEAIRINDANECYVERCLFWGAGNINADGIIYLCTATTDKLFVSNCFFGWIGRTSIMVQGDYSGTVYVYNCTSIFASFGNQNCANNIERSYVGIGDDLGNPPTTNGVNWQIKNTFSHCCPDGNGISAPAFAKGSASSWTNCNNNGSSDTTAPGTSAQTSLTVTSQFANNWTEETAGENTGNDVSATCDDAVIKSGSATTNFGTADGEVEDASPSEETLTRWDLSNVSNSARILGALINVKKSNTNTTNKTLTFYRLLRAWVEGQVTWNIYSTGNNWGTAGALGAGTDVESANADGATAVIRSAGFEVAVVTGNHQVQQNEWHRLNAGKFVEWVQDAIDGSAPGADANDFEIITRWFAGNGSETWYSNEDTDGDRPEVQYWFDTAASPMNIMPKLTGSLDGNGVDLGSDTDYAIGDTDLYGLTRDATWDIGAVGFDPQTLTGAVITQAGVAYDGVLVPGLQTLVQDAAVNVPGVGYDGVIQGADFLHPIYPIQGGWTGEATDIDEEPPVDADFIASAAAPTRVQLLNNGGFEGVLTVDDWLNQGPTRVAEGGAQEGAYVGEVTGASSTGHAHGQRIPVDPDAIYELSAYMRRTAGTIAKAYLALIPRRSNDSQVYVEDAQHSRGAATWITADVDPSDTTCQVADTSKWDSFSFTYMRVGVNPDESDLGNEGHLTKDIRLAATPFTGNTVNFFTTAGQAIPKGTWVRPHQSGGTYIYPTVPAGYFEIPATWTRFAGRVGPGHRDPKEDCVYGEGRGSSDLWWPETAFAQVLLLLLYETVDSTTVQVDDVRLERLDNVTYVPLKPTLDPQASDRHHVRYRYAKDVALGTVNLKVRLLMRTNKWTPESLGVARAGWYMNEIASWQHNDIGTTPTTVKQTLSGAQADAIAYSSDKDLWLEFEATS